MPAETTFTYYDAFDALLGYGGDEEASLNPYPLVWAAIREEPSWEHVSTALLKVGTHALSVGPEKETARFAFDPNEEQVIAMLRERPWKMHDLSTAGVLSPSMTQLLVYCLLITKQVEVVPDVAAVAAPEADVEPPSSRPSDSTGGRQVARMKLQAKVVPSGRPIAVESRAEGLPWDRRQTPPEMPAQAMPASSPPSPRPSRPVSQPSAPAVSPPAPAVSAQAAAPLPRAATAAKPIGKPAPIVATALPPLPFDEPAESAPPFVVPAPAASPPAPMASPPAPMPSPSAPVAAAPQPVTFAPVALTPEQAARKAEILDRATLIPKQDYFEMLGLARDATPEQATTAYFALAKKWHPDRLPPALAEAREDCAKVFTHLTEAHQTLTDKEKRARYMNLLKEGGRRRRPKTEIVKVIEAATNFQKAEVCLRRNDIAQAEEICKKCIEADPDQADYVAMIAWIDALKPANQGPSATQDLIGRLSRAITMNAHCERAYFYRGMLYKRIQREPEAVKDFRKAYDLNPRNVDAQREVRLAEMRGVPGTVTARKKKAEEDKDKGGLFGKLFKK